MNLKKMKKRLIGELVANGYLKTERIIKAFEKVQREDFVLPEYKNYAYVNEPLPIGFGQTISQPLTVAVMTEALEPKAGEKILEVGTGSGYQAALLAEIVGKEGEVITTEIVPELTIKAKEKLKKYKNITIVECDGSKGYKPKAPYDKIIVTASAPTIPEPLINQLKLNGRMVIPVGNEMYVVDKVKKNRKEIIEKTMIGYYVFVPLVGEYGYR